MSQIYLCDCCGEKIEEGRETSNLRGFRDICPICYQGLINLKKVVKLTKKDILLRLEQIIEARNG